MYGQWMANISETEYLWLYIPPRSEILTDGSQTVVLVIFLIGQLPEEHQEL
jgi:hypothetical protein